MENVMKNLLLAAAAATVVFAVSPVFASIADEAEQGLGVYPSAGQCHFVRQAIGTQNGHVTYQVVQVCNSQWPRRFRGQLFFSWS
jgi:hypothetical protein